MFFWLIALAAGAALVELLTMASVRATPARLAALTAGAVVVLLVYYYREHLATADMWLQGSLGGTLMTVPAALTMTALLGILARYPKKSLLLIPSFIAILGVLYIFLFLSYLIILYTGPNGKAWIFFVLIVLWCSDTGAYAVGRTIGRHKLSPLVSPNKTVEGAVGGAGCGLAAALILNMALLTTLSLGQAAALGLVISLAGQVGDLCESALKRHFGCKDSGGMLPGHGGMLDRLDSLLFAAPLLWYCRLLIE